MQEINCEKINELVQNRRRAASPSAGAGPARRKAPVERVQQAGGGVFRQIHPRLRIRHLRQIVRIGILEQQQEMYALSDFLIMVFVMVSEAVT